MILAPPPCRAPAEAWLGLLAQFLGWNKASRDHVSIGYYPPGCTSLTALCIYFLHHFPPDPVLKSQLVGCPPEPVPESQLVGAALRYTGNTVVAHEFQYNVTDQLIYDQNGVQASLHAAPAAPCLQHCRLPEALTHQPARPQVYSNPAFHYQTPGPVSLKLVWNNITVSYSGASTLLGPSQPRHHSSQAS